MPVFRFVSILRLKVTFMTADGGGHQDLRLCLALLLLLLRAGWLLAVAQSARPGRAGGPPGQRRQ